MEADSARAVEIVDLVKHYTARDGRVVRAVDGISFHVHAGELVGLLGANGAGKTTTLRLIATLLSPTSGSVRVAGCDVSTDPIGVRRRLGYLSATTGVADRLTAREIIRSHARLHGLSGKPLESAVDGVVERLRLSAFADRPCGRLSRRPAATAARSPGAISSTRTRSSPIVFGRGPARWGASTAASDPEATTSTPIQSGSSARSIGS